MWRRPHRLRYSTKTSTGSHALRYTWNTFLLRNGISLRVAQSLMRHSDSKLTANVYTDEKLLGIPEAIKGLPSLLGCTQIRAQILGAEGQNVAEADARRETQNPAQPVAVGGVWRGQAWPDAPVKLERAKGFEPSTFTLAR